MDAAAASAGYRAMAPAMEAAVEAFYTVEDVAAHNSKADCWVIVHDGACAWLDASASRPLGRDERCSSAPGCLCLPDTLASRQPPHGRDV